MSRRHQQNNLQKVLKEYMVPLIALWFFIILIFAFFWWSEETSLENTIENENRVGMDIQLATPSTEAYVVYPGENRQLIDESTLLYKGEKILVKEWSVSTSLASVGTIALSKLAEFSYEESGDFSTFSWESWIDSIGDMSVMMRYAHVQIGPDTHVSLSQNEVGSSVYLLSGFAEVKNLAGVSTLLAPGQKITISTLDASKEDIDLSIQREDIDEFFLSSNWFISNNGAQYLDNNDAETESDTPVVTQWNTLGLISFDNLIDESVVSAAQIDITGSYDPSVAKILVNGVAAELNNETNAFVFSDVATSNRENDLIFKVYNLSDDLLSKTVYTLYYEWATATSAWWAFSVTNYAVDASNFTFTAPSSSNVYTTTEAFITIKWQVLDKNIASVSVNDYTLRSYNGSTWRYHASVDNNNFKTWTNVYVVKYFDASGTLVYQNNYTLVKKAPSGAAKETETISDEA